MSVCQFEMIASSGAEAANCISGEMDTNNIIIYVNNNASSFISNNNKNIISVNNSLKHPYNNIDKDEFLSEDELDSKYESDFEAELDFTNESDSENEIFQDKIIENEMESESFDDEEDTYMKNILMAEMENAVNENTNGNLIFIPSEAQMMEYYFGEAKNFQDMTDEDKLKYMNNRIKLETYKQIKRQFYGFI
ncbi:hypothetical protein [Orgyia pseudotsugata single capsid nuclopolyhedrovirus]|nr:hypothetical protein [Orgyia pseudotsugata single capsid nuclopolyhedrovirus]